jgi:hypothetical protein
MERFLSMDAVALRLPRPGSPPTDAQGVNSERESSTFVIRVKSLS